jgi:hypothetical protein
MTENLYRFQGSKGSIETFGPRNTTEEVDIHFTVKRIFTSVHPSSIWIHPFLGWNKADHNHAY